MAEARTDLSQGEDQAPNFRRLAGGPLLVWVILLIMLAASAGSAFLPLGSLNPTLNLLIAAGMLLVLAAFLMELKDASALLRLIAAAGLFWVVFLFALTFTDYFSRRPTAAPATSQSTLLGPAHGR